MNKTEAKLAELSAAVAGLTEIVTRLTAEDIDARPDYWRAVHTRLHTMSMMAKGIGPQGAARGQQLAELKRQLPVVQEAIDVVERAYTLRKDELSGEWRDWLAQCNAQAEGVDEIRESVLAETIGV